MTTTMNARQWLLLVALSMLWGGSFFFFEVALRDFGPLTVVLGRVGLAAIWLRGFLALSRTAMPRELSAWRQFAVMGLLNNAIPFGLIVWGQQYIESGMAAILNASTPLFTVLFAHYLTRDERLTPGRLAGVLLGLAGVILLIGPGALAGADNHALGQAAMIAAAVSYALAGIYGRRFRGRPPMVTATGQVTCAAILVLPFALVLEQPWRAAPGLDSIGALLGLSLLCTALAYILYFKILAAAGATNLLLVTLLIPPSALLLGILILGERPGGDAFAGLALIALGLLAIDGRPGRRLLTFLAGSSAPRA
jgi:drug/metabolite transporter (DMT)-like permease